VSAWWEGCKHAITVRAGKDSMQGVGCYECSSRVAELRSKHDVAAGDRGL
jgi:hypothetical protein